MEGIFSHCLKMAKFVPNYTSRQANNNFSSYRNVCMLNQKSKNVDYCFNVRLTNYLETSEDVCLTMFLDLRCAFDTINFRVDSSGVRGVDL